MTFGLCELLSLVDLDYLNLFGIILWDILEDSTKKNEEQVQVIHNRDHYFNEILFYKV